jgi:circadian clock protein KaiC
MTLESVALSPADGFTGERVSFVTDDIVVLRYVELDAVLEKLVTIAKMRRSQHSQHFWRYDIGPMGVTLGEPLVGHANILTGSPTPIGGSSPARAGLVGSESKALDALVRWGEAPLTSLAMRVGLPVADMGGLMSRLVALGYAVRVGTDSDEDAAYRAVARGEGA